MHEVTIGEPRTPDEHEAEFAQMLRIAAFLFEKENDGRFKGSILACLAVVEFIRRRDGGAELAGPFVRIAEAFRDLEKGGQPALFSKKTKPVKERARSPERKLIHSIAAAALAVLVRVGIDMRVAADRIARHVQKWPGMSVQNLRGSTIIAWHYQQRGLPEAERKEFDILIERMAAEPDPEATVEGLLRKGPPGLWSI